LSSVGFLCGSSNKLKVECLARCLDIMLPGNVRHRPLDKGWG
jgi:hypothetical protein